MNEPELQSVAIARVPDLIVDSTHVSTLQIQPGTIFPQLPDVQMKDVMSGLTVIDNRIQSPDHIVQYSGHTLEKGKVYLYDKQHDLLTEVKDLVDYKSINQHAPYLYQRIR